jgi:MFS family permease
MTVALLPLSIGGFGYVLTLPAIASDLHGTAANLAWTLNVEVLFFGVSTMVMGRLADVIGRRRMGVAGMLAIILSSVACALAPSVELLIVFRDLQGISFGMVYGASLPIVSSAFPDKQRATGLGMWAAGYLIGAVVGTPMAGLLADAVSWRALFWLNVPLTLIAFRRRGAQGERAADRLRTVSQSHLQGLVRGRDGPADIPGSDPFLRPAVLGERAWPVRAHRGAIPARTHGRDVRAHVDRRPYARPLRRAIIDGGGRGPARAVLRSPVACRLKEGVRAGALGAGRHGVGASLAFNASNITGVESIEAGPGVRGHVPDPPDRLHARGGAPARRIQRAGVQQA